jgi:hypothetical protein
MGSITNKISVTGTTPVTATLPVGSYSISITPATLPSNSQCNAKYTQTLSITANTTTQEAITYIYTPAAGCSINAQCNTWCPGQACAGSSCNLYITTQNGMTPPTILTMAAIGITSLTNVWNAQGSITNGNVVLELTNPVYTTNVGFNAVGNITLPSQATITTNGQVLNCPITSNLNSKKIK